MFSKVAQFFAFQVRTTRNIDTAWYDDVDYVIRVDARDRGRDALAATTTPVLWFPPKALAIDREALRERQQAVAELVMGVGDHAKPGVRADSGEL